MRYETFSSNRVIIPHINYIGGSSNIAYGPTKRNQYLIHYVLSGKGYFNGALVKEGQGFLITPGMHEEYHPDESDPWTFLWVVSYDNAMQYFFDCHNADPNTSVFTYHDLHEMKKMFENIKRCTRRLSPSTEVAELFLHIFNRCVKSERQLRGANEQMYYDFAVNYINQNLHSAVTVQYLCELLGITQPYLYNIFKSRLGCSPKQYISDCKLTQAKDLLSKSTYTISQIADSLGFPDVMAFSKFFLRKTGISPTQYRIDNFGKISL